MELTRYFRPETRQTGRYRTEGNRLLLNTAVAVIVVLAAQLLLPGSAAACDFCGCVTGINPYYSGDNRIGISTLLQRSRFEQTGSGGSVTKLLHGVGTPHQGSETISGTERRLTIELSYRHHLSRRFLLTGLVPFTLSDVNATGHLHVQGFGDATLLGHYVIDGLFSERRPGMLLIGGGVKFPTGDHTLNDDNGEIIEHDLQPGSGSFDLVGNALLTAPVGMVTLAADLYGKLNGSDGNGYSRGNSLALTGTGSYDLYRDNPTHTAVVGTAGLRAELAGQDVIEGEQAEGTGAETLWATLGAEVIVGSAKLNLGALVPLSQRRDGSGADEEIRFTAGVAYEFR